MDQNQPSADQANAGANASVDNDLQKAIDDITNTTSTDPVFSDPVAAPSSVPEGDTGELGEPVGPFPEPKIEIAPPAPEPIAPLEALSDIPELSTPEPEPAPAPTPAPAPAPESQTLSTAEVKKAALRDLVPLLGKISMDPLQKFTIYRDIFENLKDYTILDPAYHVARDISDETKRAEALLYLVESINKM